jgi:radical SAM superfamily enzyme YgiQ (UPF0313 family)
MPIGVIGLINLLQDNGVEVKGLNLPLEQRLDRSFDLKRWLENLDSVEVVLLDLHWYEHSFGAIDLARACKQILPDAWVVVGGFTASAFAREILETHAAVDFVIRGDAEEPLLQLVSELLGHARPPAIPLSVQGIPNLSYRDGRQIVENPLTYCATTEMLDRLNFCDLDFLVHERRYYAPQYVIPGPIEDIDPWTISGHWLCIARGCHYECSFCGGCRTAQASLANRHRVVRRSPRSVAADLQHLASKGILQVSLSFDLAELGEDYWSAVFAEMERLEVKVALYNEFFQLPSPAFIARFAEQVSMEHSCVALSPLSGSERVRRLNGKRFSSEQLFHTLRLLKAHSVPLLVYFSLNLPGENQETFQQTLALARQILDLYPAHLVKLLDTLHTLDPLSPMSVQPENYGICVSATDFADYYHYCALTSLASPEARMGIHRGFVGVPPQSIQAMANQWDKLGRERGPSVLPLFTSW